MARRSRSSTVPSGRRSVPSRSSARSLYTDAQETAGVTRLVSPTEAGARGPGSGRVDGDLLLRVRLPLVLDDPVHERKQREVASRTHVLAGVNRRSDLTHEDV